MVTKVIGSSLSILLFPVLIILLSWDLAWSEGWAFSIWLILLCYSAIYYFYRKDPVLLEERYKKPGTGNEKGWTGASSLDCRLVHLLDN